MKKIFLILLFIPIIAQSQLIENFNDGNFTINPTWVGDTAKFTVLNQQLRSNSSIVNDKFYLSTPSSAATNTQWEFYVNLKFQTSSANYVDVYLTSDSARLTGNNSGYFVKIGDTDDHICLYKKNGATSTMLIDGANGITNTSNNTIKIKVTRDAANKWTLARDLTGTGNSYVSEGNVIDATFSQSSHFGLVIKQSTTSFILKHFFDDIYVGPIIYDTIRPVLKTATVVSANQVDILFSENIDTASAQNISNYVANNNLNQPLIALLDASNGALVHLTFQNHFTSGLLNTLNVSNVKDIAGNVMLPAAKDFLYYVVRAYDIEINELMADPDPVVELPAFEYIELFNRTAFPISLRGFKLTYGSTTKIFPDTASIEPNGYLIITKTDAIQEFSQYGKVIGLFTSIYSLTNDGQTILLSDPSNNIISYVNYTLDWYHDNLKNDGGWSIEQIDPANPCGEINNWKASVNSKGGTPGSRNSVFASNPDYTVPSIVRIGIVNDSIVQVYFNESLDSALLKNVNNYSIDHGIGNPLAIRLNAPEYKTTSLTLNKHIQPSIIYTLTIQDTISDCVGNILPVNSSARFALPEEAFSNEIVINEVLYNPKDDGVDYVEIYNRSKKVIDLKTFNLSSYKNNAPDETVIISAEGFLMFPEDYVVLTTNALKVKSQYYTSNPNGFNEMSSFPSFNNDSGTVVIAKKNGEIIDKFSYQEKMQFPLLNSTDGVSLERINFDRPAADITNWNSASETVGFGTPAYKNSQYSNGEKVEDPISVDPEIFSPDNDGYNDIVTIHYNFDTPGYIGNIVIYDANGRLIRNLVKNELLSTSGTFSWNGINDNNEKGKIGIYIIYVEVFDTKGNVKKYKKTCVLAAKL